MEDTFLKLDDIIREKFRESKGKKGNPKATQQEDIIHLSGCTATVLLALEDHIIVANCGDSPAYLFRETPGN